MRRLGSGRVCAGAPRLPWWRARRRSPPQRRPRRAEDALSGLGVGCAAAAPSLVARAVLDAAAGLALPSLLGCGVQYGVNMTLCPDCVMLMNAHDALAAATCAA